MTRKPRDKADILFAAYPSIRVAVSYTELIVCGDAGEPNSWDLMMSATMSPKEVIDCIRSVMDGESKCRAKEALKETYHPEFTTYIRGKMGAV